MNVCVPQKSLFIGIDGVVPIAKMNLQRLRRFKSPVLKEWDNEIKKKFNIFKEELFDTNQITPGTDFMKELGKNIKDSLMNGKLKLKKNVKAYFSDSNIPGEGEHKVMEHIRKSDIDKEDNICVYGLDADLIMLTLIQENNNMYLLRENTHINSVDETIKFLYVSIYDLKVNLFSEINSNFINNFDKTYVMQNIVNDYVFLCFLLGNDFLHSLPSLKINTGGIDFILKIYCNILKKIDNQLVLKSKSGIFSINHKFLLNIFKHLSNSEESNLKYLQSKKRIPNIPAIEDAYMELKYKWDRIPLNDLFKKYYNVIDYRSKNCKNKYYKVMFKLNINDAEFERKIINK